MCADRVTAIFETTFAPSKKPQRVVSDIVFPQEAVQRHHCTIIRWSPATAIPVHSLVIPSSGRPESQNDYRVFMRQLPVYDLRVRIHRHLIPQDAGRGRYFLNFHIISMLPVVRRKANGLMK